MSVPVEDEQVERRVVDTFPYPIAVNLANARHARLADASERELHQLLATGEALIHLLGSVCLLDLVSPRSTSNVAAKLDDVLAPNGDFIPKPDRPSIGDWIHFIGKCTKHIERPFLRETAEWSGSERTELLDLFHGVRRLRNDFSHPHPTPSEVRAQHELPKLRPLLAKILKRSDFLGSYTMLAVGDRKDGQVLVTRLRGSTTPRESHWLDLTSAIEREGVVLADPGLEECIKLHPFYLASEAQDDADRIWAYGCPPNRDKAGYYVVDHLLSKSLMGETIMLRRRIGRPSEHLRRAADDPGHSPRIPLQASESAREAISANAPPPPELGYVVGADELKRLPGSMSLVFEGRVSGQPPHGMPAEGAPLNLPDEGTRVVIKVARQGDANAADNRCIRAELELLTSISSRYVPKAYGLLVDDQGRNHLVLEHRDGDRLSTRLQSTRIDGEELVRGGFDAAAEVAEQLVLALADVHRHGFHGDLKPSNVLVSSRNRVSLIDFGAGHVDEDPGTEMIPAFGTRGYVAPEIFLPTDEDLDRKRSDLYSLGVVVYELFAGRLPKLDAKREGLDVSAMPGPRAWRLLVRWCGLVDPRKRPENVDDLLYLLRGRIKAPTDIKSDVPYRTIGAKIWNSTNIVVIVAIVFITLICADKAKNLLYLTFPIAGSAYLTWSTLRGHWQDAVMDGLDTSGARRHVTGVVWRAFAKVFAFAAVMAAFIWSLTNLFGPFLDFTFDGIAAIIDLLGQLSVPMWLENVLIIVLSLGGLGAAILLHRHYEHAE